MKFLESDLEDIIFNASQTEEGRMTLMNRGLNINSPLKRQVNLGSYGIADLIDVIPDNTGISYNVIELKKVKLCAKDIMQTCRYMTGIKRYLRENTPSFADFVNVNGMLIGPGLKTTDDLGFLINELYGLRVLTYDYDLEKGLNFTHNYGFHNHNEAFPSNDIHLGMQCNLSDQYFKLSDQELKELKNNA